MQPWVPAVIAVIGTLAGGVVGAVSTYLTQRIGYRREADERLASSRRVANVEFLTAAHAVYSEVNGIHKSHKYEELTQEEAYRRLRAVSPHDGQAALESLRLLSTDKTAWAAADLWRVLRGSKEAQGVKGNTLAEPDLARWRQSYWSHRQRLVNAARLDTGLAPLDWSLAGGEFA